MPDGMIMNAMYKRAIMGLHMIVLAGAIALIGLITYDTVRNISFIADPFYMPYFSWRHIGRTGARS